MEAIPLKHPCCVVRNAELDGEMYDYSRSVLLNALLTQLFLYLLIQVLL